MLLAPIGCSAAKEGSEQGMAEGSSDGAVTSASETTGASSGDGSDSGSGGGDVSTGIAEMGAEIDGGAESSSSSESGAGESTEGSESSDTGGQACFPDATEHPASASFEMLRVPFFRGLICTVDEAKAGFDIPATFKPCLHPCVTTGTSHFKRWYNCFAGECDSWAVLWFEGSSGSDCPEQAFGRFSPDLCTYDLSVEVGFKAPLDENDQTFVGTFHVVWPFMSNDDIVQIDEFDGSVGELVALMEQKMAVCPPTPDRVHEISISEAAAQPPASCADDPACECLEVGFTPAGP